MNIMEENIKILERIAKDEYQKITTEHSIEHEFFFPIFAYTAFNNKNIRIEYFHHESGSGYGFNEIQYTIKVPRKNQSYSFNTREAAELFLKKTKSKAFPDKTKIKIKKEWGGLLDSATNLKQLGIETTVLEFKKTIFK